MSADKETLFQRAAKVRVGSGADSRDPLLRAFPGHVSNHHLGTMLGLLGATYEMLEFSSPLKKGLFVGVHSRGRNVTAKAS